jgi:hypothetical protein
MNPQNRHFTAFESGNLRLFDPFIRETLAARPEVRPCISLCRYLEKTTNQ